MLKDQFGVIICGFSGVGKTTLGKKYDSIAEIGQSLYKNIYLDKKSYEVDREHRKNIKTGVIRNPEWPINYINQINELRKTHDLVLVFTDFELMDAFRQLEIPFVIAFPDLSRKQEFISNFRKRGQDEAFCEQVNQVWDEKILLLSQMKEEKMILKQGQYLEDVLIELGYIPKSR